MAVGWVAVPPPWRSPPQPEAAVELAGTLQPFAAVDGHHLAVDVANVVGHQECGEVRQFLVPPVLE